MLLPFCGCTYFQKHGLIKAGGVEVAGVKDAGKPATLATEHKEESLAIPEGSKITVTKIEAVAPVLATKETPGQPAQPAKEVTEVILAKDSEWRRSAESVKADTGTVDTSVRQHEIDVASSQPLLYAAIASGLAAILCLYLKYPTPAAMCGGAALVFLVAWKVSNAPPWLWGLGACGIAAAVALYLGHERGLKAIAAPAKEP